MAYFFERFLFHFSFYVAIILAFVLGFFGHVSNSKIIKVILYLLMVACLLFVIGRILASFNGVDNLADFFLWIREHYGFVF